MRKEAILDTAIVELTLGVTKGESQKIRIRSRREDD